MALRLNLGAGFDVRDGYCNVDWTRGKGIDLVLDLETFPWPWADDSVDEVLALNLFEHVHMDLVWREIHRILKVGGTIKIEVVNGNSHDPFHHSIWSRASIRYLTNGYATKASPKYAFKKIDGPHYRHIPSGFPWWHIRHYLGFSVPPIPGTVRHLSFTLEKIL